MTVDDLITALDKSAEEALPPAARRLLGPGKVPPASRSEIEAFEAEVGARLPDDYRRFLLRSNGGTLGGKYFFENAEAYVVVNSVGGFQASYSLRGARGCYQGHPARIPRALVWVMDDPGGNAVCLGVTGKHRGLVYFWVHDEEPDPDDWDGEVETAPNIRLLANSFTEFVAG